MKDAPQSIRLFPPAKVNLILRIGKRLPNGYHRLWSLMQTVGLTDELTIRIDPLGSGIRFHCSGLALDHPADNLVYRAAQSVLEKAGTKVGVEISLKKHIPVAAGLGGGSSDAAATIVGLNHLLGCEWSREDMIVLGQQLGSDVPFFFAGPTAVVEGVGEQLTPVTLSGRRWVLLVNPGFPIPTSTAYQRFDEFRSSRFQDLSDSPGLNISTPLTWKEVIPLMRNDFEEVLLDDFPELGLLKMDLLKAGADTALVSGSGATVFGIFSHEHLVQEAKARCSNSSPSWRVMIAETLSEGLVV